jgi:hypothetical protein
MNKIPVVFCIDVEPDEREIERDGTKKWKGFEATFKALQDFRPRLEAATGSPVNFSWFFRMDPQIEFVYGSSGWVAREYAEALRKLEETGDEFGLHTHAWRWDEKMGRWIIDHGDPQWVRHCLNMSFSAFQSAFGRSCLSFRFGDRWMNNETLDYLESLGVKYELTVEPGMKPRPALKDCEAFTGSLPDYRKAPARPYRPALLDFTKDSREGRNIWMIPLSTSREAGRFAGLKRAMMALGIDLQKRHDKIALNLSCAPRLFREIWDRSVQDRRLSYLAPILRTDAPVTAKKTFESNLNHVLSHPMTRRLQFMRPAEIIEILSSR